MRWPDRYSLSVWMGLDWRPSPEMAGRCGFTVRRWGTVARLVAGSTGEVTRLQLNDTARLRSGARRILRATTGKVSARQWEP